MQATRRNLAISALVFFSLSVVIVGTGCQGLPSSASTSSSKTLTAVAVSPASASVSTSGAQQFTATASYSDGSTANVTSTATWTTSATTVARVNSSGLATAASSGSVTVAASLDGVSGSATLKVSAVVPTLTSVAVSPTSANINVGATQQFTATATYSDGSTANVSSAAGWTSVTAVATINSSGLATGVASGSSTITASVGAISGTAELNVAAVTKPVISIAITPSTASISVGSYQQFTATATYGDGSTGNITSTAAWTVGTPAVAGITSSGLATGAQSGSTSVIATSGGVSGSASLDVTAAVSGGANITTFHFDANRSGLNSGEIQLAPGNVSASSFGKLFSYLVDGYVYGQALLVSNLAIGGSTHNVLFAATENDSVYAFDADNYGTGAPLWQVTLLQSGETAITDAPIQPVEGVTSTPAIDLTTNTMYVVSAQTSASGSTFRLNALDITTGTQRSGSPVTIHASVAGVNATTLTTSCLQRAALLVANSSVYIGFGSCHSGWLLAYDEATLAQTGVFNASPNLLGEGTYASAGGVWMGGGGPAADDSGNIYVTTGNGPWNPAQAAYSDSVLKFSPTLTLEDYFTPYVYQYMDCADADLASGGLLLIPGTTEALAGGKTGKLYLVNTTNLGQEHNDDTGATQTLWFESDLIPPYEATCDDSQGTETADINSYEIFGTSAYFNGSVYLGVTPTAASGVPAFVRQFPYSGSLSQGAYVAPNILEGSNGYTLFISANGTSNGIVWVLDHGQPVQSSGTTSNASLIAYDAGLTTELYNSSAASSGDVPGYGIKFSSPMVANGKVYISTAHDLVTVPSPRGELDVYGLK